MRVERATIAGMADNERMICASGALAEAGHGVRFEIEYYGRPAPAFAVRYGGQVHAYLNRCGHIPMELDWTEGEFFDDAKRDLLCSTHGALYDTRSGRCMGGPCKNTPLVKLDVIERAGLIYFAGIQNDR